MFRAVPCSSSGG